MSVNKTAIAFVADATEQKGVGHIVRCSTIANVLRLKGYDSVLLTTAEYSFATALFDGTVVNIPQFNDRRYVQSFRSVLNEHGIVVCVFDLLENDLNIHRFLADRKESTVIAIWSFLYEYRPRFEQCIIYPDILHHSLPDGMISGKKEQLFYSGPEYLAVRDEFTAIGERQFKKPVYTVLVTMGGSDPYSLTEMSLLALCEVTSSIEIRIVIGKLKTDLKELNALVKGCPHQVVLINGLSDLSQEMHRADIALINGGMTRYELAVAGTPFIALSIHALQYSITERMASQGGCVNLGVYSEISAAQIAAAVDALCRNPEKRKSLSDRSRKLVDGKGKERIANIICSTLLPPGIT